MGGLLVHNLSGSRHFELTSTISKAIPTQRDLGVKQSQGRSGPEETTEAVVEFRQKLAVDSFKHKK